MCSSIRVVRSSAESDTIIILVWGSWTERNNKNSGDGGAKPESSALQTVLKKWGAHS